MKGFKTFAVLACASLCAFSFTACAAEGKSVTLGKPATPVSLTYEEEGDKNFAAFKDKVEKFASSFAAYAYEDYEKDANFAVSPISVYMALSLAAECANGETREELLSALGVSYGQLTANFPLLYRSLAVESKSGDKVTSMLVPTNSIWVNDGAHVNQSCIDALSNYYYCYSHSADFRNGNQAANQAIRDFVKEQTRGLIDKDFKLSDETLFTLINTLYLKTIWNRDGDELSFTDNKYDFTNKNGSVKSEKLLQGYYKGGRVYKDETFSTFYTRTYDGYAIKFILPNEGYTVNEVFTAENIEKANNAKYQVIDEEKNIYYATRCLFPEYKCGYDEEIRGVLKAKYGIERFFKDPGVYSDACDFSTLSPEPCFCSSVKHVTDLTVNKKGIEGAAVTVIAMDGASAGPDFEYVYEDFVIDRAFGFIITDYQNVTLFSGAVHSI